MRGAASRAPHHAPRTTHHAPRTTHHSGVALVITVVLISVITFMAVTFLIVSRSQHGAVATQFAINVSNLADKNFVSTCGGVSSCYYGTGRTVTATARFSW